eukprot:contig_23458_g5787
MYVQSLLRGPAVAVTYVPISTEQMLGKAAKPPAAAFVPNSHGNVVLDCFRLYEASMAGAIPVIVASAAEFRTNF